MQKTKRLFALVIAALMLIGLTACGPKGDPNDPNLGVYEAKTFEYAGIEMDASGDWLELMAGGRATISIEGDEFKCKWKLDGNNFTLEERGDTFKGTLEAGVIVLDIEGITYTFAKPGAYVPSQESASEVDPDPVVDTPSGEYADQIAYWNGDWYGWWWITSAEGDWAHLSEKYYDMYCTIEIDNNGEGYMEFWDDDAGLMKVEVVLDTNNNTEHGILTNTAGYLWDFDYDQGEWVIDVASTDYENMWTFEDTYIDPTPDEAGSNFDYFICMRPWGQSWEDVADSGERPPGYDWYMDEISSGNAMPDGLGYGNSY
ncbi:MAG TPA: hypothetical protein GX717_06990 [Clostridiaceae bacterium]|nr:hypothetical protein [Clostridiaceae bacterium]